MGCHALLQGIFLTQGSNPCLKSPALAVGFFTTSSTWEALDYAYLIFFDCFPLFLHILTSLTEVFFD